MCVCKLYNSTWFSFVIVAILLLDVSCRFLFSCFLPSNYSLWFLLVAAIPHMYGIHCLFSYYLTEQKHFREATTTNYLLKFIMSTNNNKHKHKHIFQWNMNDDCQNYSCFCQNVRTEIVGSIVNELRFWCDGFESITLWEKFSKISINKHIYLYKQSHCHWDYN